MYVAECFEYVSSLKIVWYSQSVKRWILIDLGNCEMFLEICQNKQLFGNMSYDYQNMKFTNATILTLKDDQILSSTNFEIAAFLSLSD